MLNLLVLNLRSAYSNVTSNSFIFWLGSSNMASVKIASHKERNPLAPNLYSNAFETINSNASSSNSNSTANVVP